MSWKTRLARLAMDRLSRQETLALAGDVLTGWLDGLSGEEKTAFLQALVEENLGLTLAGLSQEERGRLMNALLATVAREFPLADLDILGVFGESEEA